ncbi:sulfocyanin, partial [Acidianus sp. DSM 29099]|nr:sulfocyanin [Acidianus sp. RZ1]
MAKADTPVIVAIVIAIILVAVAGYYVATRTPIDIGTTTLPPSTTVLPTSSVPVTTTTPVTT